VDVKRPADICYSLEEGVYRYEPHTGWVRVDSEPAPYSKGMLLVFVNVYCKDACLEVMRAIEEKLWNAIESGEISLWLVVWTKFLRLCWNESARRLFYVHKVYGSPTVIATDGMGVVVGSLKGPYMVSKNITGLLERFISRIRSS